MGFSAAGEGFLKVIFIRLTVAIYPAIILTAFLKTGIAFVGYLDLNQLLV